MAAPDRRHRATDTPAWTDAAEAMYRAAQAVAGAAWPGHDGGAGPGTGADPGRGDRLRGGLHRRLARHLLRTLAAVLDGKILRNFDYPLQGFAVRPGGRPSLRFVALRGVARGFAPGHDVRGQGHGFVCRLSAQRQRWPPARAAGGDGPPADRGRGAGRGPAEDLRQPPDRRDRAQQRRRSPARGGAGRLARPAADRSLPSWHALPGDDPGRRDGVHLPPPVRRTTPPCTCWRW